MINFNGCWREWLSTMSLVCSVAVGRLLCNVLEGSGRSESSSTGGGGGGWPPPPKTLFLRVHGEDTGGVEDTSQDRREDREPYPTPGDP